MDELFPQIKRKIENLIEDEEGNIPGNRLLTLGTLVVLLGILLAPDAFAAHRSHRSHSSHRAHRSSNNTHGSHASHASHSNQVHNNHSSHSSHESHISHTSHSNNAVHSNSRYSAEGDVSYAPAYNAINGITVPPITTSEEPFQLLDVNEAIELPNSTPGAGLIPNLAAPVTTVNMQFDSGSVETPPPTETVE